MDRSLKARLIGASILVLLVVLVVPELLSGRKSATTAPAAPESGKGPTRTYTIELGNTATPAATDAVVPRPLAPESPPLASEQPVKREAVPAQPSQRAASTAAQPGREAPASRPPAAPPSTTARPAKSPSADTATSAARVAPAAAASPARGTWSVQVGAFGSADAARKLVDSLGADGYAAYVSTVKRDGKTLHRVRVGPESARGAADALAVRLKARGLPVTLVAND